MNLIVWIVPVIALVAVALAFAPRREITTEMMIAADPSQVWTVLTDTPAYPEWNPFIVSVTGAIVVGGVLEVRMEPEKGKQMTFRPRVLVVRRNEELRWLGRFLLPRIFDGEHYFLLEAREGATRLVHGERFRGIGLWLIAPERFRKNFDAMNRALKMRIENAAGVA